MNREHPSAKNAAISNNLNHLLPEETPERQMSIIYAIIAKNEDTVLVECNTSSGNYPLITREILKKIPKNKSAIYSYNSNYLFHCHNETNLSYVCLTDAAFSKVRASDFLQDLKTTFLKKFKQEEIESAIAYGLDVKFGDIMKERLVYYNENKEGKIEKLKDATYQAKEIMVQSVDEILDRGRKIELLVKKTQNLDTVASGLKQRADQYRSQEKWKSIRLKVILALIAGVG